MATGAKVIAVTRKETRNGDPMWTLQTAGGDRINIFNEHAGEDRPGTIRAIARGSRRWSRTRLTAG